MDRRLPLHLLSTAVMLAIGVMASPAKASAQRPDADSMRAQMAQTY